VIRSEKYSSVRTIIELVTHENYYANKFSRFFGPVDLAVQTVCKNYMYSEPFEITALCSVLGCNIRSIYPEIDYRADLMIMNDVFTPRLSILAKCEISILWCHTLAEMAARANNKNAWSPNHFVPLLTSSADFASGYRGQSGANPAVGFFPESI
jgi:hypothetical protein